MKNPYDVKGRELACCDHPDAPIATPIVFAFDHELSVGPGQISAFASFANKIDFISNITIPLRNVNFNPYCSIAAVGTIQDKKTLQVSDFFSWQGASELKRFCMTAESQDGPVLTDACTALVAYFYAVHTDLDVNMHWGRKGHFFYIGRGNLSSKASRSDIQQVIGDDVMLDVSADDAFKALKEKFHVYHILSEPGNRNDIESVTVNGQHRIDNAIRLRQWGKILSPENVFELSHPYLIGDIVLGIIAVNEGIMSLDHYISKFIEVKEASSRVEQTRKILSQIPSRDLRYD